MSNKNRGDRIQLLHKVVKKYYKPISAPEGRTVLETLIYACCLEDARYESADEAFHRLQESYFDWNEVRVTTVTELCEVLHNLPDPAAAAVRVKKNLQSIFETRYSFEIEDMVKMNQGKAIQELEKLGGISRFVLGYTIQNSLEGHAIPVSQSMMEILLSTGITTDAEVAKGVAPSLERTIAKSKGLEFFSCLHQFAVDWKLQPTSKQVKAILKEAGGVERPKVEPPKPEPKPEPKVEPASKSDKKAPTKAVAKKEEKPAKPEKVEKVEKTEKTEKPKANTAEAKPTTKAPPKSAPKAAAKPTKPAPSKSTPPAKPAKKAPTKKPTPAAKQVTKKKTESKPDSKTTKRKPK